MASQIHQVQIRGLAQLLPYLFMGSADAAQLKDVLKRLEITHIVNAAAEEVEDFFPEDFIYKDLPMEDVHDANPTQYADDVYKFIKAVKDSGSGKVLVHCTYGKNLAPAVCAAYMMKAAKASEKHLPLKKALEHIAVRFPGAQPSEDFLAELIELEDDLFGCTSIKLMRKNRSSAEPGVAGPRRGKGRRGK